MRSGIKRASIGIVLLSAAQPAWALGDFIIPQTAGLILGGPAMLALLFALVHAGTKGTKADPAVQQQWRAAALWGTLFNGLWLWLLVIFDPSTWHMGAGWSGTGLVVRFVLPSAVLVVFLLVKGWPRRAIAVMASCLLMGVGYGLLWR